MKTFITSVVCAVVLAVLCVGIPDDTESSIWFPTSVHQASENMDNKQNALLEAICGNMTPIHDGIVAQTADSPYKVTTDKTKVAEGGIVTVTVSGAEFKGIFIEARDDKENIVGTFEPVSDNNTSIVNCSPGTYNALFYQTIQSVTELAVKWIAPKTAESVKFRCTTVQSFALFWVGDESSKVQVTGSK